VPALDRTVVRHVDVLRDMSRQWMRVTFHYKWFDRRGRERRESAAVEMTAIFPRELQLLLERNGFRIDRLCGNYNASPLRSESPRMIASCRLA
jgi:hypothetical protein